MLRLWVAATDYANEISVSDEIFKRTAEVDPGGPFWIVSEVRSASDGTTTGQLVLQTGMVFGTWTLLLLVLFDLGRALFLILFRS